MLTLTTPTRVLLVGMATRAVAESAARAGFAVTAIDAFGDLDQHPRVRSLSLPRDFRTSFSARAAARVSRSIDCDVVAYASSFENYPSLVATLATRRVLWGNTADVLRRVRNPALVARTLRRRGFRVPETYLSDSSRAAGVARRVTDHGAWLLKPLASGGGRGVKLWEPDAEVPRGHYLQERIEGAPYSVVFVAAGRRAVPLGVCRQLIGDPAFGAAEYQYCGNILVASADVASGPASPLVAAACDLAGAVAREFSLVGVNGVDFIARNNTPHAIEVNPRWCASMELIEHVRRISVFGAHAAACASGELPRVDLEPRRVRPGTVGKAIVFARQDVVIGDTHPWLADSSIRDVPRAGERILAGQPVCTVFGTGADVAACHAALVRRARQVYQELSAWHQECSGAGIHQVSLAFRRRGTARRHDRE